MSRRVTLGLVAGSFFLGCVTGAYALYIYRGLVVPGKQVRNLADMQFWQSVLTDAQQATGSYPESLEQALLMWKANRGAGSQSNTRDRLQDNWGHKLKYARLSDGYILASYGRDGRCDMRDLLAYTEASIPDESPCYAANRDTVLTDRGFVKGCSK